MFLLAGCFVFGSREQRAPDLAHLLSLSLSLSRRLVEQKAIAASAVDVPESVARYYTLLISRLITEQLKWRSSYKTYAARRTSINYK